VSNFFFLGKMLWDFPVMGAGDLRVLAQLPSPGPFLLQMHYLQSDYPDVLCMILYHSRPWCLRGTGSSMSSLSPSQSHLQ
jgi:hypothetical protein